MRDSYTPPNRSGGNKGVIALLVGGFVLLGITGVVFIIKRNGGEAPTPPPPVVQQALAVPEPLVKRVEEKPLALMPHDTGAEDQDTGEEVKSRNKGHERKGTIDPKEVNNFMNARFGDVKACYERRLKNNSMLEGKLDLNISVSTSGKVRAVIVNRDTVRDKEMLACVRRTIFGWKFPKPKGGYVVVAKTFNFKKKV